MRLLRELQMRNYALIDSLDLEIEPGFTVLTGETGAGKSIILDAVAMVTGSRAYTEAIRTGADVAIVEARFDITGLSRLQEKLAELGLDEGEGELIITREIHRSGRNKCRVNGHLATVSTLAAIGRHLVEIHGQHEHRAVLDSDQHINMLDAFGGPPLLKARVEVEEAYNQVVALRAEMDRLRTGEQERLRRMDLLDFQIQEIASARLQNGEEEELEEERQVLRHAEKLREVTLGAYRLLYGEEAGDGGVLDRLGEAISQLEQGQRYDRQLTPIVAMLETASSHIQEAVRDVRSYAESLTFDPERLNQVEERLALINRLERKYGKTIAEILDYQKELQKELDELQNSEARAEELEKELERAQLVLADRAAALSKLRQECARRLEGEVEAGLAELDMKHARFQVKIARQEEKKGIPYPGRNGSQRVRCTSRGVDEVEFLFSANPGEELKPLVKVASGGEASRIMLTLKSILADIDGVPTLIFDEVDVGIGGKTARAVGAKLSALARERQVLCVTHLAQVAGAADHHLAVTKLVSENSARVEVTNLDESGRIRELARMLAGDGASEVSRQHARELLADRITP